ncbi:hypothetical protein FO519_002565 [Halicephalobus sp. NKZ332]|nr:hypothetical protein FO519_002565 [Halicephalobus sp. NKZ332]
MVFNQELGYDPDLWEECPEPEHFLAFGFFTRVGLTIVTVGLAGAFFWLLEARKEWGKVDKKDEVNEKISHDVDELQRPPPKPERRVSLDQFGNKIDDVIRRNSETGEIRSPQRDVRSSRSVERKIRESSANRNDMFKKMDFENPQEPQLLQGSLPHGIFENEGTPYVDQRNLNLGRTPLQAEPPCVTPQSPQSPPEPKDRESIEQQYRKLAKDLENKLLEEIEQLGLLKGRQNDKNAPREIAEELQQRHEKEIKNAVNELVKKEGNNSPHMAAHFIKQLENKIEDAVWQYNHKLLNQKSTEIYETELNGDDVPIWQPRTEPSQPEFDFTSSVLDSRGGPGAQNLQEEQVWQRSQNQVLQNPQISEPGDFGRNEGEQVWQRHQDQVLQNPQIIQPKDKDIWQQSQKEAFVQKSFMEMEEELSKRQERSSQPYLREEDPEVFQKHGLRSASTPRSPEELRQLGEEYPYAPPDSQDFKRGASEGAQIRFQTQQNLEKNNEPYLNQETQKRSSSSEEGFVKVYDPKKQQIHPHFEGASAPGVPRPASYDAGSSVTADDIEFVHSMQNQAQGDYPEVFEDYETLKKNQGVFEDYETLKKSQNIQNPQNLQNIQNLQDFRNPQSIQNIRLSDEGLEGFEPIQEQDIWEATQAPLQPREQVNVAQESQKSKTIDPKEEAQVLQLLQEYDLTRNSGEKKTQKVQELPLPWDQELQVNPEADKSSPNISPEQFDYDTVEDFSPLHQSPQHPQSPQYPQTPQTPLSPQSPQSPNSPQKSPKRSRTPIQVVQPGENVAEFLFQQGKPTVELKDQRFTQTTVSYNDPQQNPSIDKQHSGYENLEFTQKLQRQHPVDEIPHLAAADIYLQDAIDYMESQRPATSQSGGGFIIEEEMLESDKMSPPIQRKLQQENLPNLSDLEKQLKPPHDKSPNFSNDPTTKMIKTNEIFEKKDTSFDDADDAVTSAPEIQSIEIPPDQMSENSSNFIENLPDHDFRPGSSRGHSPGMPLSDPLLVSPQQQQKRLDSRSEKSPEAPKLWRVSPIPDDQVSVSESVGTERHAYKMRKQSSLLSVLNVTSMQEMLLTLTSLEGLAMALRKAGLESTNLIFGIDYTASNKYQGERSFYGKSLHSVEETKTENPYQQVIRIMGNSLASFASSGAIPVFGFGDSSTGDWSVFKLKKEEGQCRNLDEVLRVYNEVTPSVDLSGPTNFAPLIYEAIRICQRVQDYHILVIIADGQVTNERATRKAIVHACHYPLSIIVVGVGDGPWEMMRVFDESLPKRQWDNFHFVEFHEIMRASNPGESELAFAVQSLLEVPDQFNTVKRLGLLGDRYPRDPQ